MLPSLFPLTHALTLSGLANLAGQGGRVGRALVVVLVSGLATGCDQLGIETPQKAAEHQLAESKAIGSACRHALRAIEDCYTLNPKADKSAVFGGWREMDEYMRENKLEGVTPVVPRPPPPSASKASAPSKSEDEEDASTSDGGDEGASGKSSKKGKAKAH